MPRYSRFGGWVQKDGEWVKAGTSSAVSGGSGNEEFYKLIKEYMSKIQRDISIIFKGNEEDIKKYTAISDHEDREHTDSLINISFDKFSINLIRYEGYDRDDNNYVQVIKKCTTIDDVIISLKEILKDKKIRLIIDDDAIEVTVQSIEEDKLRDAERIVDSENKLDEYKTLLQEAINENNTTMIEMYKNFIKNTKEYIEERKHHKFNFGKRRSGKNKTSSVNADIAYLQSI